jgi:hypothetical protein
MSRRLLSLGGAVALILLAAMWFRAVSLPSIPQSLASIPYYAETVRVLQMIRHDADQYLAFIFRILFGTPNYGELLSNNALPISRGYAVFAAMLLLLPSYRNAVRNNIAFVVLGVLVMLLFVIWFFGGVWLRAMLDDILQAEAHLPLQNRRLLVILASGIPSVLLGLALLITMYLGFPLMALFLLLWLPGFCYLVLSSTVYYALWSPVLLWHYLHYLFVPHPAETAYKTGMAEHVPYPELARTVANAMSQYDLKDFERLPKRWKSKNWQKRIDAFRERLEAEDKFMEELIRNLRLKDQLR